MIDPTATRMFAEAAEAPSVVARQLAENHALISRLAARLRDRRPKSVLTCARGSSDHAATYAKYLVETRARVLVGSAAPSIASVYHAAPQAADVFALAISQSGRSPDVLASVEMVSKAGGLTAALVNDEDSPLAAAADVTLPLRAGPERSVAATKSYIAALAGIAQLVAAWSEDAGLDTALADAPTRLAHAWEADWSPLVDCLSDVRGLYVIGRGIGFGVAQEAALKFKETCGLHAEAFSAAEVRHGPMALIGPGFPVLVFRQEDETAESVDALVAELASRGGDVIVTGGPATKGALALPVAGAHAAIQPMLAIQSFYKAVNALSVRRGFDPDRPPHLAKVTETV